LARNPVILTCCPLSGNGIHINPIESNILFYTLRILHLGIQLHFIFDGPKRLSNGGKLHPGHDPPSLLLRETLTHIGVPWHEAPAEAEAECAKMEMEEIVNGVFSEDADALAFGCQTLIRFYLEVKSSTDRREDTRKSFTRFRVYKLDDIARQYPGMDREGFILYAILNGRPNDVGELSNLGPQDVLNAAEHGLGKSLRAASESEENLRQWATSKVTSYLNGIGSNIKIPLQFPRWQHVQDYVNPDVSTLEALLDLPQPQDPPLDEKELFSFLVDKFQWSIKKWVKYGVPLRIVRSLLATEEGEESQHNHLKLECDPKKSPKKAKATFLLCKATSLDTSALYEKKGEFETLMWILRKANFNKQRSIASFFITPQKSGQKGKGKGISSASASGKAFQRLKHGAGSEPLTPPSGSSKRSDRPRRQSTPPSPTPASRKRSLPRVKNASTSKNIQPAQKNDPETSAHPKDSGKGKAKEILTPPRANTKRARSPEDSNSSLNEEPGKRPKLAAEQLPSTPPAQITEPANAINDVIMIDSDSDDDEYGSFPSVADPPILLEDTAASIVHDSSMIDSSSGDEYGSFPASPDLWALT
jgi:hypothetical protein